MKNPNTRRLKRATCKRILYHDQAKAGFPGGASGRELTYLQCRRHKKHRFPPWVGGSLVQGTPVFLAGEAHGQRSLVGHRVIKSQTQLKELNTHTHTHKQSWFNT